MIEFKSSVKTQSGKTIYSGGGNIVPSASSEVTNIINRNINIKMQRLLSSFLHEFITKGKTQFIKMYVEFAEKEMKKRNQLGTGKTLAQLKSATNLFNFKQGVKPVIGVTLKINENSAKDFFEYAMYKWNYYSKEEIVDWVKQKGFKYKRYKNELRFKTTNTKTGKTLKAKKTVGNYRYYPASAEEIAETMYFTSLASNKNIYKSVNVGKSILWSEFVLREGKSPFDEIQYNFENAFAEEFENSLTNFLNSKKIKTFQKKRG